MANESKSAFQQFADCAEDAPEGMYEQAKAVRAMIGDAVDGMIRDARALGLNADNCDGALALEAAIYAWLKSANPSATEFPAAEGFGAATAGPARERVIAQASKDAAFLAARDLSARWRREMTTSANLIHANELDAALSTNEGGR